MERVTVKILRLFRRCKTTIIENRQIGVVWQEKLKSMADKLDFKVSETNGGWTVEDLQNPNGIKVIKIPEVYSYEGKTLPMVAINGFPFEKSIDIETLIIPKTMRYIWWNGWNRRHLREIIVDNANEVFQSIDGVLYTKKGYDQQGHRRKDWMELVAYPNAKGADYTVVDGTTRLDNQCFKYTGISQITLPDTLQEIGTNCFYECRNLRELVVPASVRKNEGSHHCDMRYILENHSWRNWEIKPMFEAVEETGEAAKTL